MSPEPNEGQPLSMAPVDSEALRIARSWMHDPAIAEAVWFRDINLGEVLEYHLYPEILRRCIHPSRDTTP
ncbi:MAG: hypothetical protein AMXMBFR84_25020 [Candidatus Hydrogenedentota bacterium]